MPSHRSLPLAAVTTLALLLFAGVAHPQLTMVESGFVASTLSNDFAKQIELGVGPDTCLYYGSDEGLRRRCAPFGPGTICDPSLTFPVGIAFSTGGSFGTAMYVADFGVGDIHKAPGCSPSTPFASIAAPGSIAFPPSGSPYGNFLYACEAFEGPIYRVSSTGVVTSWLDLQAAYLRFGPGGVWGTGLYATDYTTPGDAGIVRVSSSGVVTPLIAGLFFPEGFDWAFGGDLFATEATLGEIYRVKSNGTMTLFATLPGAADVAYRPGEKALYVVSNQGGLYRIVASNTADVAGDSPAEAELTVAPTPTRGACSLRFTTRAGGLTRASVVDAAGRMVRRLATGWRPAGNQSLAWDGRDESGALVRPGTYFAHVVVAGEMRSARVTIVR